MSNNVLNDHTPTEENKLFEDLVSKPKIVGYFSVDENKKYLPDSSGLMYCKPIEGGKKTKHVYFDLNEGIESAVLFTSVEGSSMSHLLRWIELNHGDIQAPGKSEAWIEPKFACSSGTLKTVMCSPYKPDYGWIVCAVKWKGTIYMKHFETAAEEEKQRKIPQKYRSWGFKFEQYMLSDDPCKHPDTSLPVVETAEFRCTLQRRFGDHSVLYTAEMDGLYSEKALKDPLPLNDLRFVELKTTKDMTTPFHRRNFAKYKLLQWWAQSFLVDNVGVLCGFRNDEGIVRKLEFFTLDEMIEMSKNYWDPWTAVKMCEIFLTHVENNVVDDCTKTIYKFERKPFGEIVMEKVSPQSEWAFLPSSYLETTRKISK